MTLNRTGLNQVLTQSKVTQRIKQLKLKGSWEVLDLREVREPNRSAVNPRKLSHKSVRSRKYIAVALRYNEITT